MKSRGVSDPADLIARLGRGERLADIAGALGLAPARLIAALGVAALGEGPDALGPGLTQAPPRWPVAGALAEPELAVLFPKMSRPSRLALSAGLLQVFDHWELSHQAAQEADDLGERAVSAYWHGIAHRREPDPGNAAYWFRRVGAHPVYHELADSARLILEVRAADPGLSADLIPGGAWDPLAFVRLCTRAAATGEVHSARAIQRVEMTLLLRTSVPGG